MARRLLIHSLRRRIGRRRQPCSRIRRRGLSSSPFHFGQKMGRRLLFAPLWPYFRRQQSGTRYRVRRGPRRSRVRQSDADPLLSVQDTVPTDGDVVMTEVDVGPTEVDVGVDNVPNAGDVVMTEVDVGPTEVDVGVDNLSEIHRLGNQLYKSLLPDIIESDLSGIVTYNADDVKYIVAKEDGLNDIEDVGPTEVDVGVDNLSEIHMLGHQLCKSLLPDINGSDLSGVVTYNADDVKDIATKEGGMNDIEDVANGDFLQMCNRLGITQDDREFHSLRSLLANGYEAVCCIWEATFCVIYEVIHHSSNEHYAVKILLLVDNVIEKDVARELFFLHEVKHPNIISLKEALFLEGSIGLVMEYHASDLNQHIKIHGEIQKETIKVWLRDIISAVECLHHMGIIHRDLKPGNILVDKRGHLQVADFGSARTWSGDVHLTPGRTTYEYSAPEICLFFHGLQPCR